MIGTNMRVMARHKNQTARRRQLTEAAGRAIIKRGAGAVRLKDIADQAGVTPGAVLYYYADVDELLVEVHRTAGERFCDARAVALERISDARLKVLAAVRTGLPTGPDDEAVRSCTRWTHWSVRARCTRRSRSPSSIARWRCTR